MKGGLGRSVANPVGRSVREHSVFDQFSWNLAEMQCNARHIFRQWQKECCHGNGNWQKWGKNSGREIVFDRKSVAMVSYYGKNGGKILRTTSSVFHQPDRKVMILRRELLPQVIWKCLPWGVDVQDTTVVETRKNVIMKFGTDVCLGV